MSYESEDGKDAWKRYRRMVEAIDPTMQEMLHEFGSEQFAYGYAAGVQAALNIAEAWADDLSLNDDDLMNAISALTANADMERNVSDD